MFSMTADLVEPGHAALSLLLGGINIIEEDIVASP